MDRCHFLTAIATMTKMMIMMMIGSSLILTGEYD